MFKYDKQSGKSYLVYQLEGEDQLSSFTLNMLQNNQISGIAPLSFYQIDEDSFVRFDITSKIPANDYFSESVKKAHLLNYMNSVTETIREIEDYMIDSRTLCLELDKIFVDVDDGKAVLICLPLETSQKPGIDFQTYFKSFMQGRILDTNEDGNYAIRISNYLNGKSFSLQGFEELIKNTQKESARKHKPVAPPKPPVVPKQEVPVQPAVSKPPVSQSETPTNQSVYPAKKTVQPNSDSGFSIPDGGTIQTKHETTETSGGKSISLWELLRNYSKENAELYKKQKAAAKAEDAGMTKSAGKKDSKKKDSKKKESISPGFAVPGQEATIPVVKPAIPVTPAFTSNTPRPVNPGPQNYATPISGTPTDMGTVVLDGSGDDGTVIMETADLGISMPVRAFLIHKKTGARILLEKEEFKLGRSAAYCDYSIPGNKAVSSSHAKIIFRDGRCYVVDTNSKNHTYVNGNRINSMEDVLLEQGDVLRLANEEFELEIQG